MYKKLAEKFFINQTTPQETERILEWFDTPEGKQYLKDRLDIDYDLMDRQELLMVPELNSDELYESIMVKIGAERKKDIIHKPDWVGYAFKAVAVIMVTFLTSLFFFMSYSDSNEKVVEREPIQFQTSNNENREITLADGSVIRLNKNSEIVISKDFLRGTREVQLNGEAFFDVAHNPEQPFIIQANGSNIRVLGTSFNVKSLPEKENVQVAVVDGSVSLANNRTLSGDEPLSVVLTKGQYGYMDLTSSTIQVDNLAVENYLAWKNGKFVFEDLNMQQVCTQLKRIYEIQCRFAGDEIKNLLLTANFSNESLDKTLEVIALSLNINYENKSGTITWYK